MSTIYEKLLKDKLITEDTLTKDEAPAEIISTNVLVLNLGFSGKITGALPVGKMMMFSAPSQLGKTLVAMSLMRDAQRKGIFCVYFDCEFQWDWELAKRMGIDCSEQALLVVQNNSIEEVQSKIMQYSKALDKSERQNVFYVIDSWGSLVTYESVKKAEDPKASKDMGIVIKKNNLANMMMNTRSTFFIINNVYDNVGGYGDPTKIAGGKRLYHNCHSIILGKGRSKEEMSVKGEDVLVGTVINCRVQKSRMAKEYTEFQYRIKYNGGLDIYYGILADAVQGGYVEVNEKTKYITRKCVADDKKWREREIYCSNFWLPIFQETDFVRYLEDKWSYKGAFDIADEDVVSTAKSSKDVKVNKEEKPAEAAEISTETSN